MLRFLSVRWRRRLPRTDHQPQERSRWRPLQMDRQRCSWRRLTDRLARRRAERVGCVVNFAARRASGPVFSGGKRLVLAAWVCEAVPFSVPLWTCRPLEVPSSWGYRPLVQRYRRRGYQRWDYRRWGDQKPETKTPRARRSWCDMPDMRPDALPFVHSAAIACRTLCIARSSTSGHLRPLSLILRPRVFTNSRSRQPLNGRRFSTEKSTFHGGYCPIIASNGTW